MKFLLQAWYGLRSLALRGPVNSLLLLRDEIRYERMFGIKTSEVKVSGSDQNFHYQGAPYRVLMRLFKQLPPYTREFVFFDIGCGKGRAAFVAEYNGFRNSGGIDLSEQLIQQANANIGRYALKKAGSTFRFQCANATGYDYPQAPAVYFLFNPFNEEVLRKVLDLIVPAARAETWFVYINPMYQAPFFDKKIPLIHTIKTNFYNEAMLFCLPGR